MALQNSQLILGALKYKDETSTFNATKYMYSYCKDKAHG